MDNEFDYEAYNSDLDEKEPARRYLPESTELFVDVCRLIIGALAILTLSYWQCEGLIWGAYGR